jgi:hypothetical protein
MIFAFETKDSTVLSSFLFRYENPESFHGKISKGSFIEFRIKRFKDLIIISQVHLFDEVCKWLVMASVVDLLLAYYFKLPFLFFVGGIFALISIMWLSPYFRFFALKFNIKCKGHKDSISFVKNSFVVQKVLFGEDNESG